MGEGLSSVVHSQSSLVFSILDPIYDGFWVFIVCGEKKTRNPQSKAAGRDRVGT